MSLGCRRRACWEKTLLLPLHQVVLMFIVILFIFAAALVPLGFMADGRVESICLH